jgi:tetratricopeptide (TPR) repeat protein
MKSLLVLGLGCSLGSIAVTLTTPPAVLAVTAKEKAAQLNAEGVKLFQTQDFRGAINKFSLATTYDPQDPELYFNRGYSYMKGFGDFASALQDFDKAIRFNPKYTEAYGVRAYVKLNLKDYKGSLADYDRVIADSPQSAAMWQERALLKQAYLKDLPGALRDFDKAIELAPNDAMNYGFRGLVKRDLGQKEAALVDFRRSLLLAKIQKNNELAALMLENINNLQR